MNFNLEKELSFARALKPNDIKTQTKNWSTIEGYVYIISKVFPPYEGDPPLNCVKVGFSNVTTREKFEKGYTRLLGFRTSLISFKVHRIYLFEKNDFDEGKKEAYGLSARMAESMLHRRIDDKFKPTQVRIKYHNDNPTEWWNVKEKQMAKFLDFCDKTIQLDTSFPPIWGTEFTSRKSTPIKFPNRIMGVGVSVDETGVPQKKKKYRNTNNKYARDLQARRAAVAYMKSIQAEKAIKGAKRRELEKTMKFWEGVFLGKKFTDKKMHPDDKGYFKGKKIIDEVFKADGQTVIGYAPDVREAAKTGGDANKQEQIFNGSGYLTINEALLYYPSLKKKYKASYDWYVKKNKFEEDEDYTEAFT